MNGIFDACCKIMTHVGNVLGLSYKEICVIGNLYLQGGVLWLSGTLSAVEGLRLFRQAGSRFAKLISACGVLDGLVSTALYVLLLRRYPGGGATAFDRCVADLIWSASKLGITYEEVNILFFVFGFLIVLVFQLAFFAFIGRTRRLFDRSVSNDEVSPRFSEEFHP